MWKNRPSSRSARKDGMISLMISVVVLANFFPCSQRELKSPVLGDSNQKRLRSALERESASAACDKVSETKKGVWLEQRSTRR